MDIPVEKITALVQKIRDFCPPHETLSAFTLSIADELEKMVDDEAEALDAYYEKMAREAFEMEDGRMVMEDAAIEKGLRYLGEG